MKKLFAICIAITALISACEIMPRNTWKDCREQGRDSKTPGACYDFCDCIHKEGQTLDSCLARYDKAKASQPSPKQ